MNEFVLREALLRGMSPRADAPRDSQSFSTLEGCKTSNVGIIPYPALWEPLAAWIEEEDIEVSPPFPQIYCGRDFSFIFLEQAVYLADTTGTDWAVLFQMPVYDALSPVDTYEIQAGGGQWSIAECGSKTLVAANGTNTLILSQDFVGFYGIRRFVSCPVCEHLGRLLYGIATENTSLRQQRESITSRYITKSGTTHGTDTPGVWWTSHRAEDFPWRIWPWMMVYGSHGVDVSRVQNGWFYYGEETPTGWDLVGDVEYDAQNQRLNFDGTGSAWQSCAAWTHGKYVVGVYVTRTSGSVTLSIGDTYGDPITTSGFHWAETTFSTGSLFIINGNFTGTVTMVVCALVTETSYSWDRPFFLDFQARNDMGYIPLPRLGDVVALKSTTNGVLTYGTQSVSLLVPMVDPEPGFGQMPLASIGPAARHSVCGDENLNTFADTAGCFWQVAGTKANRLDYQHLELSSPIASFDPILRESYFNVPGSGAYCVSESGGVSLTPYEIAAMEIYNGAVAVVRTPARFTGFRAVTESMDFGARDIKTVRAVYVALASGMPVDVTIECRMSYGGEWAIGSRGRLTQSGWVRCVVSGAEFRVTLDSDGQDIEIDYIRLLWEPLQKTSIREVLHG